jgi:hypothetical protein
LNIFLTERKLEEDRANGVKGTSSKRKATEDDDIENEDEAEEDEWLWRRYWGGWNYSTAIEAHEHGKISIIYRLFILKLLYLLLQSPFLQEVP